jgi:chromosome segregation ATPase
MRWGWIAAFIVSALGGTAEAQIFKYKKGDGTVVYTDNLSQLPKERREHYNKLLAEREKKKEELISAIGQEEYDRRAKEKEKADLEKQQMEEGERQARLASLNSVLAEMRDKKKARDASEASWRAKAKEAKEKVDRLLAEFNATQEKYLSLATKASFTLLPGQQEEMAELEKKLGELEAELDGAIEYLEFGLYEEARKAGIPPGWIR